MQFVLIRRVDLLQVLPLGERNICRQNFHLCLDVRFLCPLRAQLSNRDSLNNSRIYSGLFLKAELISNQTILGFFSPSCFSPPPPGEATWGETAKVG